MPPETSLHSEWSKLSSSDPAAISFIRNACESQKEQIAAYSDLYLAFMTTLAEKPFEADEFTENDRLIALEHLVQMEDLLKKFQRQSIRLLLSWSKALPICIEKGKGNVTGALQTLMLLEKICTKTADYIDESELSSILQYAGFVLMSTSNENLAFCILSLIKAALLMRDESNINDTKQQRLRFIQNADLEAFMCSVSRFTIQSEDRDQEVHKVAWGLVEAMIGSQQSRSFIFCLLNFVEKLSIKETSGTDMNVTVTEDILAGTFEIVELVMVGEKFPLSSLPISRLYILKSFRELLEELPDMEGLQFCHVIAKGIVKTMSRVIATEKPLSLSEWEVIAESTKFIRPFWEKPDVILLRLGDDLSDDSKNCLISIATHTNAIVKSLQSRYLLLPGSSAPLFYSVLMEFQSQLSQSFTISLIDHQLSLHWLAIDTFSATLRTIVDIFFIKESRGDIRKKVLTEVAKLSESSELFQDVIVDIVKEIILSAADSDGLENLESILACLDSVLENCEPEAVKILLDALIVTCQRSNNDAVAGILAEKLVQLFSFTLMNGTSSDAVFEGLINILSSSQYESAVLAAARLLLSIRCDSTYRVVCLQATFLNVGGRSSSSKIKGATMSPREISLDVGRYLGAICDVLATTPSWKVYSLILTDLPLQVQNTVLFNHSQTSIEKLCSHLCMVISEEKAAHSVKDMPATHKRSDVYLQIYRLLGTFVSFCTLSSRTLVDDILQAFQLGLHRWPSTAKGCLQILTLALSLFPSNMTRLLSSTLLKVSRITSMSLAPHILEFLSVLARHPQIYVNCADGELKRVFGIALQYIQSPGKDGSSVVSGYMTQLAYHVVTVWFVSLRLADRRRYVPFIIRYMLPPGSSSLNVANLDESVELILDTLLQHAFVDCSLRPEATFKGDQEKSKDIQERYWVYGNAVMSIRSGINRGWCEMVIRRSSGILTFRTRLENRGRTLLMDNDGVRLPAATEIELSERKELGSSQSMIADVYVPKLKQQRSASIGSIANEPGAVEGGGVAPSPGALQRLRSLSLHSSAAPPNPSVLQSSSSEESLSSQLQFLAQAAIDPAFFILQLSQYPPSPGYNLPLALAEDDVTVRSIKVLDRIPVVDLHKIGLVYIGPNQENEVDILSNTHGSRLYTKFVSSLGRFMKLSGISGAFTGGLDTSEYEVDGKFGLLWEDTASGTQIAFHTTTLMPTNLERDPQCSGKKRHIGNDFMLIAFDESGLDTFSFDTFPGQFNYINIIIKPVGILPSTAADNFENLYNRTLFLVKMRAKEILDIPQLGLFFEDKIVPGAGLAGVIRRSALHANMLALNVAHKATGSGMFVSNILERLRQIKRISAKAESSRQLGGGGEDRGTSLDFSNFI
ncbi:Tuberous sclerosis 2-like protein [Phlyctochytrium planicorne]|nr:Tuberous sclerosis 2-like protein [Phlyctochytrium planicorne]